MAAPNVHVHPLGGATTTVPGKQLHLNKRDASARRVNQVTQVMSKMKLGKPQEDMIVGSQWSVSDPGTESSQVAQSIHPRSVAPCHLPSINLLCRHSRTLPSRMG
jgi:hypothetical protein